MKILRVHRTINGFMEQIPIFFRPMDCVVQTELFEIRVEEVLFDVKSITIAPINDKMTESIRKVLTLSNKRFVLSRTSGLKNLQMKLLWRIPIAGTPNIIDDLLVFEDEPLLSLAKQTSPMIYSENLIEALVGWGRPESLAPELNWRPLMLSSGWSRIRDDCTVSAYPFMLSLLNYYRGSKQQPFNGIRNCQFLDAIDSHFKTIGR